MTVLLSVGLSLKLSLSLSRGLQLVRSLVPLSFQLGPLWVPLLVGVSWVAVLFGALFVLGAIRAVRAGKRWVELWLYLLIPLVLTMALSW